MASFYVDVNGPSLRVTQSLQQSHKHNVGGPPGPNMSLDQILQEATDTSAILVTHDWPDIWCVHREWQRQGKVHHGIFVIPVPGKRNPPGSPWLTNDAAAAELHKWVTTTGLAPRGQLYRWPESGGAPGGWKRYPWYP